MFHCWRRVCKYRKEDNLNAFTGLDWGQKCWCKLTVFNIQRDTEISRDLNVYLCAYTYISKYRCCLSQLSLL